MSRRYDKAVGDVEIDLPISDTLSCHRHRHDALSGALVVADNQRPTSRLLEILLLCSHYTWTLARGAILAHTKRTTLLTLRNVGWADRAGAWGARWFVRGRSAVVCGTTTWAVDKLTILFVDTVRVIFAGHVHADIRLVRVTTVHCGLVAILLDISNHLWKQWNV